MTEPSDERNVARACEDKIVNISTKEMKTQLGSSFCFVEIGSATVLSIENNSLHIYVQCYDSKEMDDGAESEYNLEMFPTHNEPSTHCEKYMELQHDFLWNLQFLQTLGKKRENNTEFFEENENLVGKLAVFEEILDLESTKKKKYSVCCMECENKLNTILNTKYHASPLLPRISIIIEVCLELLLFSYNSLKNNKAQDYENIQNLNILSDSEHHNKTENQFKGKEEKEKSFESSKIEMHYEIYSALCDKCESEYLLIFSKGCQSNSRGTFKPELFYSYQAYQIIKRLQNISVSYSSKDEKNYFYEILHFMENLKDLEDMNDFEFLSQIKEFQMKKSNQRLKKKSTQTTNPTEKEILFKNQNLITNNEKEEENVEKNLQETPKLSKNASKLSEITKNEKNFYINISKTHEHSSNKLKKGRKLFSNRSDRNLELFLDKTFSFDRNNFNFWRDPLNSSEKHKNYSQKGPKRNKTQTSEQNISFSHSQTLENPVCTSLSNSLSHLQTKQEDLLRVLKRNRRQGNYAINYENNKIMKNIQSKEYWRQIEEISNDVIQATLRGNKDKDVNYNCKDKNKDKDKDNCALSDKRKGKDDKSRRSSRVSVKGQTKEDKNNQSLVENSSERTKKFVSFEEKMKKEDKEKNTNVIIPLEKSNKKIDPSEKSLKSSKSVVKKIENEPKHRVSNFEFLWSQIFAEVAEKITPIENAIFEFEKTFTLICENCEKYQSETSILNSEKKKQKCESCSDFYPELYLLYKKYFYIRTALIGTLLDFTSQNLTSNSENDTNGETNSQNFDENLANLVKKCGFTEKEWKEVVNSQEYSTKVSQLEKENISILEKLKGMLKKVESKFNKLKNHPGYCPEILNITIEDEETYESFIKITVSSNIKIFKSLCHSCKSLADQKQDVLLNYGKAILLCSVDELENAQYKEILTKTLKNNQNLSDINSHLDILQKYVENI